MQSDPSAVAALAESSLDLIEHHQHPTGAYPACPDYPVYRFCWLRDGSFIADAMSRANRTASADAFFGWCARVIDARADRVARLVERVRAGEDVPDADLLPTRYTLDGADDQQPWWNFQMDGYGTWLWALAAHRARHPRPDEPFASAIATTVDYLVTFGTRPCFDWWEEEPTRRHVSTLAAVAAGLRAATRLLPELAHDAGATGAAAAAEALIHAEGRHDGSLIKWVGSTAVDGSLLACITAFGTVAPGSDIAEGTYARIRGDLQWRGVYRYRGDTFYGGGEWPILTAWLGWYEALTGRDDDARARLEWIASVATADGRLPEQVSSHAQDPSFIPEWTRRWGPVATPLLWSHAMFVTLVVESKAWSHS